MKTWKPDTCGCEIEEIYNGTEIIGGGQVLKKCSVHMSVLDGELYGVLYSNPDGENKRKNQVHRILLGYEDIKDLGLEEMKKDDKGRDLALDFENGVECKWHFTGEGKNRKLNVEITGANLTLSQKNKIKNSCNNKFGLGKVDII